MALPMVTSAPSAAVRRYGGLGHVHREAHPRPVRPATKPAPVGPARGRRAMRAAMCRRTASLRVTSAPQCRRVAGKGRESRHRSLRGSRHGRRIWRPRDVRPGLVGLARSRKAPKAAPRRHSAAPRALSVPPLAAARERWHLDIDGASHRLRAARPSLANLAHRLRETGFVARSLSARPRPRSKTRHRLHCRARSRRPPRGSRQLPSRADRACTRAATTARPRTAPSSQTGKALLATGRMATAARLLLLRCPRRRRTALKWRGLMPANANATTPPPTGRRARGRTPWAMALRQKARVARLYALDGLLFWRNHGQRAMWAAAEGLCLQRGAADAWVASQALICDREGSSSQTSQDPRLRGAAVEWRCSPCAAAAGRCCCAPSLPRYPAAAPRHSSQARAPRKAVSCPAGARRPRTRAASPALRCRPRCHTTASAWSGFGMSLRAPGRPRRRSSQHRRWHTASSVAKPCGLAVSPQCWPSGPSRASPSRCTAPVAPAPWRRGCRCCRRRRPTNGCPAHQRSVAASSRTSVGTPGPSCRCDCRRPRGTTAGSRENAGRRCGKAGALRPCRRRTTPRPRRSAPWAPASAWRARTRPRARPTAPDTTARRAAVRAKCQGHRRGSLRMRPRRPRPHRGVAKLPRRTLF
mmetsp:Transcript_123379/g.348635  ORF Transcript_123379/g.348635 Transcript_123379/m.348635 type:complete len:642 (+) Transcript_123379:668-2593(+)